MFDMMEKYILYVPLEAIRNKIFSTNIEISCQMLIRIYLAYLRSDFYIEDYQTVIFQKFLIISDLLSITVINW